jgi:hypothetical protein
MRASSLLLGLWLLNSCSGGHLSSTDSSVEQYLRLAVALGARDPDSLDYYYGPDEWVADIRENPPSLHEIKTSALKLIERLNSSRRSAARTSRDLFLINQLRAISARADLLLGIHRNFDEEAEVFFGIKPLSGEKSARLEQLHAEIARLLPGSQPLAMRYAAFDQEFVVPAERLPNVVDRAMQACRERTIAHITLPRGEQVRIEYVNNKPWSAFSHYLGNFHSRIEINTDFPLTIDRALELACHEGYPGHHVYNSLQDAEIVRGKGRMELTAQLTFSPQSFVSEAAANFAGELAFSEDARLQVERDELFHLAGLEKNKAQQYLRIRRLVDELQDYQVAIARDYLDGKLEFVRAADALEKQALMVHSEATLKYFNEFRSYMLTYTLGKNLAMRCLIENKDQLGSREESWRRFKQIVRSELALGDCP